MRRTSTNRKPRLHALTRAVSWHRRKLAVVAAVAAVLLGVNAALPPAPPTVPVVRTTGPIEGGRVLTAADVTLTRLPTDAVPGEAVTTVDAVVGRTVVAPLARGQVLTRLSISSPVGNVRAGRVVAPLRLADADVAALLHVGDAVDVVAADGESRKATIVARAVRVVALPRQVEADGVSAGAGSLAGALVLVDVDSATATLLAQAAVTATLSVVLR